MLITTTTEQDEQIARASHVAEYVAEYVNNLMEILTSMDAKLSAWRDEFCTDSPIEARKELESKDDRIRDLEGRERELLAEVAKLEQRLAEADL